MTKRRWWRRWPLVFGVLLAAGGAVVWRVVEQHGENERELARVRAELDATDPGWRFANLVAAHNAALPPDDQNGTPLIEALGLRPAAPCEQWRTKNLLWMDRGRGADDANLRPSAAAADEARAVHRASLDWIADARRLRDRPRGGHLLDASAGPLTVPVTHPLSHLRTAKYLHFDALVSAASGELGQAITSLHAGLNTGRVAGADRFFIGLLVRRACAVTVCDGLHRVLAWSEPTDGLAELLAALAEEATAPLLTDALRTERAWHNWSFDALADGRISTTQALGTTPGATPNPRTMVAVLQYDPHRTADHTLVLEIMTQNIAVSRRPAHEWEAAFAAVPAPPDDHRHILSQMMLTPYSRIAMDFLRTLAVLRTAAVAVACERFRRANGRWPTSTGELKDLPAEVLLDPHDGLPLRLRRLDDGVIVYSVGADRTDEGGKLVLKKGERTGLDAGFRLWDPAHRSAPPREPAKEP